MIENSQISNITSLNLDKIDNNEDNTECSEFISKLLYKLKNTLDPQKWDLLNEIYILGHQQKNKIFSSYQFTIENYNKSVQDLFMIKYELSLNLLNNFDLIMNFRNISKLFYLNFLI